MAVLSQQNAFYNKLNKQHQHLEQLYEFRLLIEKILTNLHVYLNVINQEGKIIYSFGSGLLALGLSNHQLVGKNVYIKYPHLAKFFRRAHKGRLIEFCNVGKTNGVRWEFTNWLIPLYDQEYQIVNLGISKSYFSGFRKDGNGKSTVRKVRQELENEMSEMVKKVAHDLRSPLNSIMALMEIIEQKSDTDRLTEEFKMTRGVIQRMKSLIISLLNHNQESNPLLDKLNVDCHELLTDIKTDLLSIMGKAEIIIVNKNLPIILANPTQLHQLFLNLIDNAVKYNDADQPKVWIRMKELNDAWQFSVKDNGMGISKKHLKTVFENKKRVNKQKRIKGMGIGLATCKSIVENHDGKIWVKSKPGKGATFYFTLSKYIR